MVPFRSLLSTRYCLQDKVCNLFLFSAKLFNFELAAGPLVISRNISKQAFALDTRGWLV